MNLSEFLKTYRRENGLSQRQLAKMVGISHAYISLLEKNRNPATGLPLSPTVDNLKRIATGLGMTLQELLEMVDVNVDISESMPDSRIIEIRNLLERLPGEDIDEILALVRIKAARRG